MNKLIGPAVIVVFFLCLAAFAVNILASSNQATNVTGTEFNDTYNMQQKQQSITVGLFSPVALFIIGIFALGIIGYMRKVI